MKNLIYLIVGLIVLDFHPTIHKYYLQLMSEYRYGVVFFPVLFVLYYLYIYVSNMDTICIKDSEDDGYVLKQLGEIANERGGRVQKEFK